MREFVLVGERKLEFRDYEEPPLAPGEVRVRAIVSGIKHGTEMTLYSGETPFRTRRFDPEYRLFLDDTSAGPYPLYPLRLGSWLAGEVTEVGAEVAEFKIGDRVHGGLPHRPTNVCPADRLYRLPPGMKPETAVFTDPALFALGAVHDAQIKVGDNVAIIGLGAIGLLAVQIARLNGAEQIFAVDLIEDRLRLAQEFGADAVFNAKACDPGLEIKKLTNKKGVDVVIEGTGSDLALQTAIRCVHVCGLVVTFSYYKGKYPIQLGGEWHHNRPQMISSMPVWEMPHRSYPMWDLKRLERIALRLLETNRLITEPMISRRFRYEDALEAYQLIDQHPEQTIKTLLDYDQV